MDLETVENSKLGILMMSTHSCSVCGALDIKIRSILDAQHLSVPYLQVKMEDFPELKGKYMVFSAPVVLLLKDGKVVDRRAGVFSLEEWKTNFMKWVQFVNNLS